MPLSQLLPSQKRKSHPNDVTTYDLIILGSGIAGLAAARLAEKDNKSVLVVDKGRRLGGRVSTRRKNGFFLTMAPNLSRPGEINFPRYWQMHAMRAA